MHQTMFDDPEAWEIVNGRRVLRDRHRIRVRLADAQHSRDRPRVTDSFGRPPGNRPGFILDASRASRDARQQSYLDYETDLQNAWKRDQQAPAGAYPYRPELVGSACTINGADGRLVKQGDFLVCKPTTSFNGSNGNEDEPDPELAQSDHRTVADIQKSHVQKMNALYQSLDQELASRWRNPA
jgi:hypothetical protein